MSTKSSRAKLMAPNLPLLTWRLGDDQLGKITLLPLLALVPPPWAAYVEIGAFILTFALITARLAEKVDYAGGPCLILLIVNVIAIVIVGILRPFPSNFAIYLHWHAIVLFLAVCVVYACDLWRRADNAPPPWVILTVLVALAAAIFTFVAKALL
jgi:hypothetical protein